MQLFNLATLTVLGNTSGSIIGLPCMSSMVGGYFGGALDGCMHDGASIRARHFVPMDAHLVDMGAQCRPNGRPWAQNVWLWRVWKDVLGVQRWLIGLTRRRLCVHKECFAVMMHNLIL